MHVWVPYNLPFKACAEPGTPGLIPSRGVVEEVEGGGWVGRMFGGAPAAPGTVAEAGGGGPGVSGWLRTDITHKIELACFRTWKSGGHCTGHCLRLMYLLASHASFLMLIWT